MTTGWIFLAGILIAGGLALVVAGAIPATPRLDEAIARLDLSAAFPTDNTAPAKNAGPTTRAEQLGGWLYRRSPLKLTAGQERALQLRGRSVTEFYADKAVWMIIGLTVPAMAAGFWALMSGTVTVPVPVLGAALGGIAGFFVPDLLLREQSSAARSDASSALLMYIDLVTLERLSNASSTQALQNAAELSDVPLFRRLRAALERARLEQQAPFVALRRLADELGIDEFRDLADVMQLDETGAALSGSLRARVRELRDAQLASSLRAANAASEGMTVYMTIPSMIFALVLLIPALMRLVTS